MAGWKRWWAGRWSSLGCFGYLVITLLVTNLIILLRIGTHDTTWTPPPGHRPHHEWRQRRQALFASDGPRKLYLMSYMRGGSTLLGEAFNHDPRSWYWYEPLNYFYGAYFGIPSPRHPYETLLYNETHFRQMPEWEAAMIASHVDDLLSCRLRELPPETLASEMLQKNSLAMRPYVKCMEKELNVMNSVKVMRDKGLTSAPKWSMMCCDSTGLAQQYCGSKALTRSRQGGSVTDIVASIQLMCPRLLEVFQHWDLGQISSDEAVYNDENALFTRFNELGINITSGSIHDKHIRKKFVTFRDYIRCSKIKADLVDRCLTESDIEAKCRDKHIRVTKNLRLRMVNMERLLQKIPDLLVVHYIRDPRAIALSHVNLDKCRPVEDCFFKLATRLCVEVAEDLLVRTNLEMEYPGVFVQIRYEDLILDSDNAFRSIYHHINKDTSDEVLEWFVHATHARSDGGRFSVNRHAGSDHISDWRSRVNQDVIASVTKHPLCHEVLRKLGYT